MDHTGKAITERMERRQNFVYVCLKVNPDSWQMPGYVPTVVLARFSEVVCFFFLGLREID